jgi:hypothetical protein
VTASSLGLISTDVTHVSFVKPLGIVITTHSMTFFSGLAATRNSGPRTTRSGLICQPSGAHSSGAGASRTSPCGAPASTHCTMVSICVCDSVRSLAQVPCAGSANHGGICRDATLALMLRAHGRVDS